MIDITDSNYWNNQFEGKKEQNFLFSNKIIKVGLILLGICIVINSALIYTFFNLLNEL